MRRENGIRHLAALQEQLYGKKFDTLDEMKTGSC